MVVDQEKLNPLTRRQKNVNREMQRIVAEKNQTPENTKRLNDLKEIRLRVDPDLAFEQVFVLA